MPRTVHLVALVAAFSSAGATIFIRQGLRGSTPFAGFWINLAVGTVGLWAAVLATGGIGRVSATGFALFALAGLIGTVGGRLLRFVSIEKVGASISAALTNLNPLISSGLAILLLGERVTTGDRGRHGGHRPGHHPAVVGRTPRRRYDPHSSPSPCCPRCASAWSRS